METDYVLVLTTLPADADAAAFAHTLVDARLAACVNVMPVMDSVYRWEGQEGPIQDIQFDPFESPWRPIGPQRAVATSPANENVAEGEREEESMAFSSRATLYTPDECADLRLAVAEYEKAILAAALEKCRWNQRAAAAALSLSYDQLRHAMRRHNLQGT